MPRWETYDDFMYEYMTLAHDICKRCIITDPIAIGNFAFDLWNHAKEFASRSHTTLLFDCVYIVGNATGNKVSIPLLQSISSDLLDGRRIKAMASYEKTDKWFLTPKGKQAIMEILSGDEDLFNDVASAWIDGKTVNMSGEQSDHWCEPCGVRSISGQERLDLINETTKPILMCPGCKKWEWDERSV